MSKQSEKKVDKSKDAQVVKSQKINNVMRKDTQTVTTQSNKVKSKDIQDRNETITFNNSVGVGQLNCNKAVNTDSSKRFY